MRILHALLGEHGALYPLLTMIENTAGASGLEQLHAQADCLRSTTRPSTSLTTRRPVRPDPAPPRTHALPASCISSAIVSMASIGTRELLTKP